MNGPTRDQLAILRALQVATEKYRAWLLTDDAFKGFGATNTKDGWIFAAGDRMTLLDHDGNVLEVNVELSARRTT